MKTPTMLTITAVVAVLTASCGGSTEGNSGTATPEPTVSPAKCTSNYPPDCPGYTEPPTEPTVDTTTPASAADEGSPAKIGSSDAFTWEDGLRVQVTEAKRVVKRPAYSDPERFVSITVQLRNGSKTPFDADGLDVKMRYGKAGEEAESAFVISDGYDRLSGKVLPGRVATGRYPFTVPAGTLSITVEVAPGYTEDENGEYTEYDSAFFEGTVR